MDSQVESWGEASDSEKGHLTQVAPEDRRELEGGSWARFGLGLGVLTRKGKEFHPDPRDSLLPEHHPSPRCPESRLASSSVSLEGWGAGAP